MSISTRHVELPQRLQLRRAAASVAEYLWHFTQMVVAMEAGMWLYMLLVRPAFAPMGYGALTSRYPLVGYWMMVVSMVLGMMALMGYHRSTWRYSLEMTIAMIAPLAALTGLVLGSLLPIHTLYGVGDPVMFVAMAAFMLFRPHDHAHGAHEHAGHQHAGWSEGDNSQPAVHGPQEEKQDEHAYHTA